MVGDLLCQICRASMEDHVGVDGRGVYRDFLSEGICEDGLTDCD